jgi:hypothetical protein
VSPSSAAPPRGEHAKNSWPHSRGYTHNTEENGGLSLSRVATTRRTELQLRGRIGLATWRRVGEQIALLENASTWWLGDWLVYGQDKYPDHYKRTLAGTTFDYQTLRNYAWVVRRFPPARRRDSLSFQHHAEVASLTPPEQDLWLDRAIHFRWPVGELRRQLRAGHVGRRKSDDSVTFLVRLNVSAAQKERWQSAAEIEQKELPDWVSSLMNQAADRLLKSDSDNGPE